MNNLQEALDYIEGHKIYIETLNTYVVTVSTAQKAMELTINKQLTDTLDLLQEQLRELTGDLETPEEND